MIEGVLITFVGLPAAMVVGGWIGGHGMAFMLLAAAAIFGRRTWT